MPQPATAHSFLPSEHLFFKLLVTKHEPCAECFSHMILLNLRINAVIWVLLLPPLFADECTEATEMK